MNGTHGLVIFLVGVAIVAAMIYTVDPGVAFAFLGVVAIICGAVIMATAD